MMVTKNNHGEINLDELVDFYELLFTAKSFDFYRKSYALATALNPYQIDEYFQKFYIDTKKYKCRKVASCDSDMNCLFDGTGALYYMEVEPVFYK